MYNVFKFRCGSDEEFTVAKDVSFEEAIKCIKGYKMTDVYKTALTEQYIFERKNSMWIYVIRKF